LENLAYRQAFMAKTKLLLCSRKVTLTC